MVLNEGSWQIILSKYWYLDFDGVNDQVDLTNDSSLWSTSLTKFSISLWVWADLAWDGNFRTIFNHGGGSAQGFQAFYMDGGGSSTGIIQFGIRNNVGTYFAADTPNTVTLGKWYHIVCVYDNSLVSENLKIYLNGVVGTAGGGLSDDLTQAINLSATLTLSNTSTDHDGRMRDFRFWKTKALSQQEVLDIYNGVAMTQAMLPDYWLPMEEGTGNPLDRISGTKVGTLSGTIWASQKGLGGPPSLDPADVIDMNKENNLWPRGTALDQINGSTAYRVFYIRNIMTLDAGNRINTPVIPGVSLIHTSGTPAPFTAFEWAWEPQPQYTYRYRPYRNFDFGEAGQNIFIQETEPGGDQEDLLDCEGGFVLACWFRVFNGYTTSSDRILVAKGNSSTPDFYNYVLFMNTSEGIGGGYRDGAGAAHYVNSPKQYNDGYWHHAIIAWDTGNGVRLFMDGHIVAQTGSVNAPDLHDQPLSIGTQANAAAGTEWEGELDEIRLWGDSGSFTAAEAAKIYYENLTTLSFENTYKLERKFGTDNGINDQFARVLPNGGSPPIGNAVWQENTSIVPDPPNYGNGQGRDNYLHFIPVIGRWTINPGSGDVKSDSVNLNLYFMTPVGTTTEGGSSSGGGSGEPQTPPSNDPVVACAAGDWGCESTTDKIVDRIQDENADVVLDMGDKGYDSLGCWKTHLKSILSKVLDARGNHDDKGDVLGLTGLMGQRQFYQGKEETYYYRIVENIAFIAMDTESSFSSGSRQHTAIKDFFVKIKANKNILWKIVFMHRGFFGRETEHGYNEGNITEIYQPIFDAEGVDVVLHGHNHNFQRTYPVKYNSNDAEDPRATDKSSGPYDQNDGAIYVTNGTGGHDTGDDLYAFEGSQPQFMKYSNDDENGIVIMKWTNNNRTLTGSWKTLDNKVRDSWVINK